MNRYLFHQFRTSGLILLLSCLLFGCSQRKETTLNIIPQPQQVKIASGVFQLDEATQILVASDNEEAEHVAKYLADRIERAAGYHLKITRTEHENALPGSILLSTFQAEADLGNEGYSLDVDSLSVVVRGKPAGLFYGVQTIFQLLPPQIYSVDSVRKNVDWVMPAVSIKDKPRFPWRGMHLDVGRHLFPVPFIKKYIDYLAMHKMNTFHWHLTEDQGWRIEIKKYPRLTEVGAYRNGTVVGHARESQILDGIRYGGYYRQDEIRDIVNYAKEHFITVVPEIEMPGHSVAALAAYPHLSCTGGPFQVRQVWGIEDDIYCAGNDSVFTFLEDVLSEVLELFPSEYIHIGGDEAPKERWEQCPKCQQRIKNEGLKDEHELQSYFIRRIEKFLNSQGRQIIGWDEILEGGLAPNAAVMSWRGTEGGIAAAQQHHDVVMSPTTYCYFNYYQGDQSMEPLAIGGFLPMDKVYQFEPVPAELTGEQARHILGAQGNVWTEYIKTPAMVEYMALPRMCALAEVVWTPKNQRDLDDFLRRMSVHYSRMDEMGINYRQPPLGGFSARNVFIDEAIVDIKKPRLHSEVRYTLDGTDPDKESTLYTTPFRITETTLLKAREFLPSGFVGKVYQGLFIKQHPMESIATKNIQNGISFQYFEFDEKIDTTGDLKAMKPKAIGSIDHLTFPYDELPEQFGIIFSGLVKVPSEGVYTFTVVSNDGSRLYIHDQLVVDNDGWHGARERYGQIALQAGLHPLQVSYFQIGGGKALRVYIEGPGMAKHEIKRKELYVIK